MFELKEPEEVFEDHLKKLSVNDRIINCTSHYPFYKSGFVEGLKYYSSQTNEEQNELRKIGLDNAALIKFCEWVLSKHASYADNAEISHQDLKRVRMLCNIASRY